VIPVLCGAREGAYRWRDASGARGCGARRPPVASRPDVSRDLFSGAWLRHARFGGPRSAAASLGPFLCVTGLPSRSALVAPPLRLAALRWRVAFVVLGRSRPPPSVSTAFLVAVARRPVTPFPGEPHTALCPSKLERWRHNTVYRTPAVARSHVLSGACDSRSLRSTRRGVPVTGCLRGPRDAEPVISPVAFRS
jgi:hypothetical protein